MNERERKVKDILIQLEIIKLASQSQDTEVLKRGFSYYLLLQEIIEDLEIKYNEIDSNKEEIESLGIEIVQKLPAPPIPNMPTIIVIEKDNGEWLNAINPFEINPN